MARKNAEQKTERSKTPITDFTNGCRTKGTAYSYRSGVLLFLSVMYQRTRNSRKTSTLEFKEYEKLASQYLTEKRNHAADMIAFIQSMTRNKTPSKTIKVKVQGVREFFVKHDIEINDKEKREINKVMPRRARRETDYDYLNIDKLQAILPHLDIRMRALTLCLSSSGARIGEVLTAKIPDINLDVKPITLYLRDTKTGNPRRVFISTEAGEAIKKWIRARDAYLKMAGERSSTLRVVKESKEDNRIFPFRKTAAYRAWDRALSKAGLFKRDNKTDRNVLNIHRLRAFFRETTAPIIGIDAAEQLLGHSDQYDDAYRSIPPEKLAQKYLQCQESLTINGNERIKRDIEAQSAELVKIKKENRELRERLEIIEEARKFINAPADGGAMGIIKTMMTPEELKALIADMILEQTAQKA
jgi:integrase